MQWTACELKWYLRNTHIKTRGDCTTILDYRCKDEGTDRCLLPNTLVKPTNLYLSFLSRERRLDIFHILVGQCFAISLSSFTTLFIRCFSISWFYFLAAFDIPLSITLRAKADPCYATCHFVLYLTAPFIYFKSCMFNGSATGVNKLYRRLALTKSASKYKGYVK